MRRSSRRSNLPPALRARSGSADGRVEIVRGHIQCRGPLTAERAGRQAAPGAESQRLRRPGIARRLRHRDARPVSRGTTPEPSDDHGTRLTDSPLEWCERRLLARIHRLTLDGLRRRIEPVPPEVYWQYLVEHHDLTGDRQRQGELGLREAIAPAARLRAARRRVGEQGARPADRRLRSAVARPPVPLGRAGLGPPPAAEARRRRRPRHGGPDPQHADLAGPPRRLALALADGAARRGRLRRQRGAGGAQCLAVQRGASFSRT